MISATCILKNEEIDIPKWLYMLVNNVSEIITVIDSSTTDKTVSIVEEFIHNYGPKIKLYHFDWCDNFATAFNFCFSKCTMQWILKIAPDTVILPNDFEKLRQLARSSPDDVGVYIVWLKNYFPAPGVNTTNLLRKFSFIRNLPFVRYDEQWNIHERFTDAEPFQFFEKHGLKILDSEIVIRHYNDEGYSRE